MKDFFACPPAAWELCIEQLPRGRRGLDQVLAIADLRYWADRAWMAHKAGRPAELPTVRELAARWGWGLNRVAALRKDWRAWADPIRPDFCQALAEGACARAPAWQLEQASEETAGQDRDSGETGTGQDRDSQERANAGSQAESGQDRDSGETAPGQDRDSEAEGTPPIRAGARVSSAAQSTEHSSQEQHAARAAGEGPAGWQEFNRIRQQHDDSAKDLSWSTWAKPWRKAAALAGSDERLLRAWRAWWEHPDLGWWRNTRRGAKAVGTFFVEQHLRGFLTIADEWEPPEARGSPAAGADDEPDLWAEVDRQLGLQPATEGDPP